MQQEMSISQNADPMFVASGPWISAIYPSKPKNDSNYNTSIIWAASK